MFIAKDCNVTNACCLVVRPFYRVRGRGGTVAMEVPGCDMGVAGVWSRLGCS